MNIHPIFEEQLLASLGLAFTQMGRTKPRSEALSRLTSCSCLLLSGQLGVSCFWGKLLLVGLKGKPKGNTHTHTQTHTRLSSHTYTPLVCTCGFHPLCITPFCVIHPGRCPRIYKASGLFSHSLGRERFKHPPCSLTYRTSAPKTPPPPDRFLQIRNMSPYAPWVSKPRRLKLNWATQGLAALRGLRGKF